MTMDVSRLGIEVKSTGINEASDSLGKLGKAADDAEKAVKRMTDTINNVKGATTGAGTGLAVLGGSLQAVVNATQQVYNTLNQMNVQMNVNISTTNNYSSVTNNLAAAHANAARAMGEHNSIGGVFTNTLKAMTAAALAYTGVNFVRSIVHAADEYTNLNAKLVVATGSQHNANVVMDQMYDVSQRLRTSLASTTELYGRMSIIMSRYGHDSHDVLTTVTGLAAALHLYGATTGESSSAMLAYAHSASTGVVHMRTLNSLMTSAPLLLRAFQDATGKSGEELRKMSTKGQLTFEMLNKALADATPKFLAEFDRIPVTFASAMQRVENAWLYSIGNLGKDTGFNTELSKGLRVIEEMIPGIARSLGESFIAVTKFIGENKVELGKLWTDVVGLIGDVITLGKEIGKWVAEISGSKDALTTMDDGVFQVRLGVAILTDKFGAIVGVVNLLGAAVSAALLIPITALTILAGAVRFTLLAAAEAGLKIAQATGNKDNIASSQKEIDAQRIGLQLDQERLKTVLDMTKQFAVRGAQQLKNAADESDATRKLMNEDSDRAAAQERRAKESLRIKELSHYQENHGDKPKTPEDAHITAALESEQRKQLNAMDALNAKFQEQMDLQTKLSDGETSRTKISPQQKEVNDLQEKLNGLLETHVSIIQKQLVLDTQTQLRRAQEIADLAAINDEVAKSLQLADAKIKKEATLVETLKNQAIAAEDKAGRAPGEVKGETQLQNAKNSLSALMAQAQAMVDNAFETPQSAAQLANTQKMIGLMKEEVEWRERLISAEHVLHDAQVTTQWDKLFDPSKAQKFTSAMVAGMGQVGKAIGGVIDAMQKYEEGQKRVAAAKKLVDETNIISLDYQERYAQMQALQTETTIKGYADMAGAMQGFFDKGSDGYKTMAYAEKAFRGIEMALALESYAVKEGLVKAETLATVEGYAKSAIASVESAAIQVAQAIGLGPVLAALGVATQAQGDPYSAFARMAAMAAAMAALGFAVSGGTSGGAGAHLAADRQAGAGKGTILGDANAQSQSISKSIGILAANSDIGLRYSSGMLSALQSIQSSLAGTANQILQSGGGLTGAGYSGSSVTGIGSTLKSDLTGALTGGLSYGLSLNIAKGLAAGASSVGIGSKRTLVDSGITSGNQSVGSVLSSGFSATAYQDIETQKKAFWITYSDKVSRSTTTLDPTVDKSFTSIIKNMVTTVTSAGVALGMSSDQIASKLKAVQISLGDISLKGLTGDQIQKQLEIVFSSFGDKLVAAGLGAIVSKFQQSGEGMLQTAVRVASGVDTAAVELNKLGLTAINFTDIINTNGDIGAEIVRQSIMVKEVGSGIGEIVNTMSGAAADIGTTYTSLLGLRTSIVDLGIAKDVTRDLINAAGGMAAFQSALDSYKKNFFSSSEQQAMGIKDVTASFAALGLAMPNSKASFRTLVESLSASGATGQALAAKVLLLSDAFSGLSDTVTTNITNATNDLSTAYNTQSTALTNASTAFKGFATTLLAFKQSLTTGDLSTGNSVDKLASQRALYNKTEAAAAGGDQTALGQFQQVAQDLLTASRAVNASGDAYTTDYLKVLADTQTLADASTGQASVADQSLAALQQQVSGLITINTSVLTVTQAIAALNALIATGISGGTIPGVTGSTTGSTGSTGTSGDGKATILPVTPSINGSHASGLSNVPFNGYIAELHKGEAVLTAKENKAYQADYSRYSGGDALVAEIKALRQEVSSLRADQAIQTGSLMAANYDANERNACTIVEGQKDAAKAGAYSERVKVSLA